MGVVTRYGRVAGFTMVTACILVLTAGFFVPRDQAGGAVGTTPAAVDTAPVERAMQAIRSAWLDELDQLAASARQFAVADDTYEFMVRPNIPYVVEHYALDRLAAARIDTVLLIDRKGTPLFWRRANHGRGRGFADAKAFFLELPPFAPVRAPGVPGLSGAARLIQGASLVVAMPIFPSSRSADSRGWLVLARALDDRQWAQYLDTVPFAVDVLDPAVLALPKGIEAALRAPLASIIRVDKTYVRGLMAIPGVNGKPFRVIRVRMPRAVRGPAPALVDAALQSSFWPSFAGALLGAAAVVLTILLLWPRARGRRVRTLTAVPVPAAEPRLPAPGAGALGA